jgi:2-polyprenyl-3-methyl-5-hydroxy-6-metoxy-1,4-benzoquinol methylase
LNCRHCSAPLALQFLDLGTAPPSNAYLSAAALHAPERWYPLRVFVCERCWLVQTEDFARADELFDPGYAYFSAVSRSWLDHCEHFVGDAVRRFSIDPTKRVVEIAANDGYLLQYVAARGIPCTGVEPTASTAAAARGKGLEIVEEFFGRRLAESLVAGDRSADLSIANNVLAHVPDINDFVAGFTILLRPHGVASFEFPHLLRLVAGRQFDTVYHEHFSYLSLTAAERIFAANGLEIFDVEELTTHGGSLRLLAQRADTGRRPRESRVDALLAAEFMAGMQTEGYYRGFQATAQRVKDEFLGFLLEAKRSGNSVAAYGAAAKGNTLLNFAGVRADLLAFVADRNPAKQGRFLPGSRIPILAEDAIAARRPDFVVILPWNLRAEICSQLEYVRQWGGRFVTAVPELHVT